jgi:Phage MuF-C-terminal domain
VNDYSHLAGWARFVNQILDGRVYRQPYVRIGSTPKVLQNFGLGPFDLRITPGKIVRISREHPEITRTVWQNLPSLLCDPVAIMPSQKRDGTVIPVLVCEAEVDCPVFVPIMPDKSANIVLSVYGRDDAQHWIAREATIASNESLRFFVREDFAATMPKPESGSKEPISSSPGAIPADGTAKPPREILGLRKKSTKS